LTKYIPIIPTPKQAVFLLLNDVRDVFYGGAGGGGKSEALLAGALQYVDVPGYSALIVRDTYANLSMPGSLMDRAHEWLDDTDAHWSEEKKLWTFPSGARLKFGFLDGPRDHLNYKSAEFQYVATDEAVDIRFHDFTYLFTRMRRRNSIGVPTRFRAASNPDPLYGRCHRELYDRYINQKTKDPEKIFISAKIDDNPHINREEYKTNIRETDPVTQAAILDGDWDIQIEGNFFNASWFNKVDAPPLPSEIRQTIRYWDFAVTAKNDKTKEGRMKDPAYTVGLRMSLKTDNRYCIEHIRRERIGPSQIETTLLDMAGKDGQRVHIEFEEEGGASGKYMAVHILRSVLPGYTVRSNKVTDSKVIRAAPFAAAAQRGDIDVVRARWNDDFFEELTFFPNFKFKDQVDSASGAYARLSQNVRGVSIWSA